MLVAHNYDFDIDVLLRALNYYKLVPHIPFVGICTMERYLDRKLKEVALALGIDMSDHHDALFDARVCAEILLALMSGINPHHLKYPIERKSERIIYRENDIRRKVDKEVFVQDLSLVENINNTFYDKKVVITGIFEKFPVRNELALLLKNLGADINSAISSKTNYVIAGEDFGPKKMGKVFALRNSGCDISIINEKELCDMLNL